MIDLRFILAALCVTACASSQRPRGARPPQRFTLVSARSLRATPDGAEAPFALAYSGPLAFRRVRARGEVIELETVSDPERQCAATLVPPSGMRLRFFAASQSIGRALVESLHLTGPEGSLTVAAGAPLRDGAGGNGTEVAHAGLRVALRDAPAAARFFAEPQTERAVARAERLAPGTQSTLPAGATVTVTDEALVPVLLRRPSAQGARVVVATPCVRLEGTVEPRAVLPVLEMELGDAAPAQPPRWVIRAGARLHWPNRGPAGHTVSTVALATEGREDGDARCFRVPLHVQGATVEAPPTVEVCAATADVRATGGDP